MAKKQLIALVAACAWISLVILDRQGLFATVALSLPAVFAGGILYCWFGEFFSWRPYIWLAIVVAGGLSGAFLKGYHDCCKPPNYFVLPHLTTDGRIIPNADPVAKLKTASEARSEVVAYSLPVLLFGSVVLWWLRTTATKGRQATTEAAVIDGEYVEVAGRSLRGLDSEGSRKNLN